MIDIEIHDAIRQVASAETPTSGKIFHLGSGTQNPKLPFGKISKWTKENKALRSLKIPRSDFSVSLVGRV